jgi:hypothetical protein
MKMNQFLGGLLVGGGIGLMVGAAIVHLPEDGSGQRACSMVPTTKTLSGLPCTKRPKIELSSIGGLLRGCVIPEQEAS